MLKLCLGILVDILFCVKWLARLSIFIHVDILVLVSEFVGVGILSEWLSVPTTVGTSLVKNNQIYTTLTPHIKGNHRDIFQGTGIYYDISRCHGNQSLR